jgi:glycine/D-amino acid oxidase-like deaminating enzyme
VDAVPTAPLPWATASLWAQSLSSRRPPEAVPRRRVEVAVVGGGLTGLLTATQLVRSGVDAIVLERHDIGGVTTRGSTGKLTALQGTRYPSIARQRGAEAARSYADAAVHGVDRLRTLIVDLGIDCGLATCDDVTFAETAPGLERAREVLEAATDAGLPVTWLDELDLPIPTLGGVRLAGQARLDTAALCRGLAERLAGRVFEWSPVLEVDEQPGGVQLRLDDGEPLVADHLVVATLGPVHDPALLSTRCSPQQSYVVACPHPSPPSGSYISADEASRSIRAAALPDGASAVVIAGEGHVLGEPGERDAQERWEALETYAAGLGAGGSVHRWTAHDLAPSDAVPFIGQASAGSSRAWVAAGFEKWGISTAMVAADLLTSRIGGQVADPSWVELFDPTRLADSATVALAKDAARSFRHAVVERVADALPGGDHRPRCTHLGCTLAWDDAERTWDCPCHGSRFGPDGQVVAGPARAPLDLS